MELLIRRNISSISPSLQEPGPSREMEEGGPDGYYFVRASKDLAMGSLSGGLGGVECA